MIIFIKINDTEVRQETHSLLIRLSICLSKHRRLSASLICMGTWAACEPWLKQNATQVYISMHISQKKKSLLPQLSPHVLWINCFTRTVLQWLAHRLRVKWRLAICFNLDEQLVVGAFMCLGLGRKRLLGMQTKRFACKGKGKDAQHPYIYTHLASCLKSSLILFLSRRESD